MEELATSNHVSASTLHSPTSLSVRFEATILRPSSQRISNESIEISSLDIPADWSLLLCLGNDDAVRLQYVPQGVESRRSKACKPSCGSRAHLATVTIRLVPAGQKPLVGQWPDKCRVQGQCY